MANGNGNGLPWGTPWIIQILVRFGLATFLVLYFAPVVKSFIMSVAETNTKLTETTSQQAANGKQMSETMAQQTRLIEETRSNIAAIKDDTTNIRQKVNNK